MNHLYGEMGFYSHDPKLSRAFHQQANEIRASLLERLDTTSVSWLSFRTTLLNNENRQEEALQYSDRWMKACEPGSRSFAIMAFFRSEIYRKMGDVEMQRY